VRKDRRPDLNEVNAIVGGNYQPFPILYRDNLRGVKGEARAPRAATRPGRKTAKRMYAPPPAAVSQMSPFSPPAGSAISVQQIPAAVAVPHIPAPIPPVLGVPSSLNQSFRVLQSSEY
jgi:hypothetical protein